MWKNVGKWVIGTLGPIVAEHVVKEGITLWKAKAKEQTWYEKDSRKK